jgi:hypothetical protein
MVLDYQLFKKRLLWLSTIIELVLLQGLAVTKCVKQYQSGKKVTP